MKVKDGTGIWLMVWTKSGNPLMMDHFFPTKGQSACGKVPHPKTQPMAAYIEHGTCKTCAKNAKALSKDLR